jgi:hypothetical protein
MKSFVNTPPSVRYWLSFLEASNASFNEEGTVSIFDNSSEGSSKRSTSTPSPGSI